MSLQGLIKKTTGGEKGCIPLRVKGIQLII